LFECTIDFNNLCNTIPRSVNATSHAINYDVSWMNSLDVSCIDLILISSCCTLRALPYLHTKFHGKILMTDPVSSLGQSLCEELIEYDEEYHRSIAEPSTLYTSNSVKEIWRQVVPLSYHQIFKYREISIAAVSSGHSLGSANWIVEWGSLSLSYISISCMENTRYPTPFNPVVLSSSVLLFSPQNKPSEEVYSAKKLYSIILETCRSLPFGCNIIIPIQSWQLLDLESHVLSAGAVFNIPTICMSPSGRAFTSYAAGSVEWLSNALRQKVYIPQNCFMFEQAKDKGMFHVFRNLKDGFGSKIKNQNIMMLSDSCLRLGEADYVITRLAKKSNKGFIILIDENFGEEVLKFYSQIIENFSVKIAYLNVFLCLADIEKMIEDSVAATIILPSMYESCVKTNKPVRFLEQDGKIFLPDVLPRFLSIKTKSEVENGPVCGFISLNNYNYTANLSDRAILIKEKLISNGFEAHVDYFQSRTVIRIPDAEVVFIGKKIMIKSNSASLRTALLTIIK
jgi:Metallo-beta-lactamase superfamily domain